MRSIPPLSIAGRNHPFRLTDGKNYLESEVAMKSKSVFLAPGWSLFPRAYTAAFLTSISASELKNYCKSWTDSLSQKNSLHKPSLFLAHCLLFQTLVLRQNSNSALSVSETQPTRSATVLSTFWARVRDVDETSVTDWAETKEWPKNVNITTNKMDFMALLVLDQIQKRLSGYLRIHVA